MKILDTKFVRGFIKMADDGFQQGWHERNGGNLSYRIKTEEVEDIRPRLNDHGVWMPIGTSVPGLAGEFFLVTGSGKYFRNIIVDPEALRLLSWTKKERITVFAGDWWKAGCLPVNCLLI